MAYGVKIVARKSLPINEPPEDILRLNQWRKISGHSKRQQLTAGSTRNQWRKISGMVSGSNWKRALPARYWMRNSFFMFMLLAWVRATAMASAASSGRAISFMFRSIFTIICTWCLSAPP